METLSLFKLATTLWLKGHSEEYVLQKLEEEANTLHLLQEFNQEGRKEKLQNIIKFVQEAPSV